MTTNIHQLEANMIALLLTLFLSFPTDNDYQSYTSETGNSYKITHIFRNSVHQEIPNLINTDIVSTTLTTLSGTFWCGTGGTGTSGCSVDLWILGCSVTCSDGYYACCSMLLGCRCYKETPSDEPEVDDGNSVA